MGKWTDKLYVTHGEWGMGQHTAAGGGHRAKPAASFARLPYDCCALSLKPFDTPVATPQGTVYELTNIIPYIKKHGTDPITTTKLTSGDLIKLNFAKNSQGTYNDPLTFKPFTEHSAIVFIKPTGNVYAKDTVEQLNIKPGSWHDLLDDTPFTRADIITIQDPNDLSLRDFTKFQHLNASSSSSSNNAKSRQVDDEPLSAEPEVKNSSSDNAPVSTGPQVNKKSAASSVDTKPPTSTTSQTTSTSTGKAAASFTSTAMSVTTKNDRLVMEDEEYMFEIIKERAEKAYVRLTTSEGQLNLELFSDKAPRAAYNFLSLARSHYYDNTVFHRLIPGFMVQGGDPTGTGKGGSSCWGKEFADEYMISGAQKHTGRGVLSMANHGKDTNASQFFITFRSTPNLNGKHTVFGHVVGGDSTLDKIEKAPTDSSTDRPRRPIKILDIAIFKDPFDEHIQRENRRKERQSETNERAQIRKKQRQEDRTTWFGTKLDENNNNKNASTGTALEAAMKPQVGKYLPSKAPASAPSSSIPPSVAAATEPPSKKRKAGGGGFGDFSSW